MTDDNGATNDVSGVTITAAAKSLGVSVRTVQRRLDSGALRSIEGNGRRLVLLDWKTPPSSADGDSVTGSHATGDAPSVALLLEQQQRDRQEIAFLRGLVEQRDRDGAELRAALREALKAMPRQLMAGTISAPGMAQDGPQTGTRPDRTGQKQMGLKSPEIAPTSSAEFDDLDDLIHRVFRG